MTKQPTLNTYASTSAMIAYRNEIEDEGLFAVRQEAS
jgi:hypothetical protein